MKKKSIVINIVGIIILVILLLIGVGETEKVIDKVDWGTVVEYPMANQNISWD